MRVGRITTGVSLILMGVILLLGITGQGAWASFLIQFWPVVFIGYGIEVLLTRGEASRRFDWGGALLLFFVVLLLNAYGFGGLQLNPVNLDLFGPTKTVQGEEIVRESGDLSSLRVESENGKITILPSSDQRITVIPVYHLKTGDEQQALKEMKKIPVTISKLGKQLVVRVDWPKNSFFFLGIFTSVDLQVYAPKEMLIEASSGNGEIAVTGMGEVGRLRTSNGRIIVKDSAGNADMDTSNGRIQVVGFKGGLNAKTGNGSMDIEGVTEGDWQLRTSNGSIRIKIPSNSSIAYELSTGNGSIDVPNPPFTGKKDDDHYVGEINGGRNRLVAETSNGSIRIDLFEGGNGPESTGSW